MLSITIGEHTIGLGHPCMLVAEIGLNHNGDIDLAKRTIDAAAKAGADAVKFQNYVTEDFISDHSLTYTYVSQGKAVVESQYEMFKRNELHRDMMRVLKSHCDEQGVIFHSTPTGPSGIQDLLDVGVPVLKNGSDYLTHLPLIRTMGETGLPTLLATGMATIAEIDDAVQTFRSTGNEQLILLHCVSSYPTPPQDVHLRKIPALASAFGCLTGYSDHTWGSTAAIGSVVLGACWIEKHFTLDKNLPGPDHRFSSDPEEFQDLVAAVRTVEQCLGMSRIEPTPSEQEGRLAFRLSCVAAHDLPAGHLLTESDLAYRRPGKGWPPAMQKFLLGFHLSQNLRRGDVITSEVLAR